VAIGVYVFIVVDDVDGDVVDVGEEDSVVVDEEDIGEGDVVDVGEEDVIGNFIILATNMRYSKTMMINTTRVIIAIVSLSILLKMKIHSRL